MNNTNHQKSSMPKVLQCMRINKDLKRYYWSKYNHLKSHNGAKYAAATFKELRQVMMNYINDTDRLSHLESYLASCPVRKNGWLRKLFAYADTQPLLVLQFLKLYTVEDEPVVSPEEAAAETDATLMKAQGASKNQILESWLWCLHHKKEYKRILYAAYKGSVPDWDSLSDVEFYAWQHAVLSAEDAHAKNIPETRFAYRQLCYVDHILKVMKPRLVDDQSALKMVKRNLPTMEKYSFFGKGTRPVPTDYVNGMLEATGGENPFEEDLFGLLAVSEVWEFEVMNIMDALPSGLSDESVNLGDEIFVGNIRQIPKNGTVVRRAIADPNKFLQAGLYPFRAQLRSITRKIPRNCQFNQDKMDGRIRHEIQNGYAGSVDLKQATDWLPLLWFNQIEEGFREIWYPQDAASMVLDDNSSFLNVRLLSSRDLFMKMCLEGYWDNEGYASAWRRGQPLGTLPSFEILTITHFSILESISWLYDRLDSPYALLGDDVVFFDRQVRQTYIEIMTGYGNPLSLHKSYEGRLTEFAGKVFIKNQPTRYCTDMCYLKWYNLFDFQRSTGVVIEYGNLPKVVKDRLDKLVRVVSPELRPEDLYTAMQICAGVPSLAQMTEVIGDLVSNFYMYEPEANGDEITGNYGLVFMDRSGTYDEEVILPNIRRKAKWWRKKNRPESTTSIAEKCLGIRPR